MLKGRKDQRATSVRLAIHLRRERIKRTSVNCTACCSNRGPRNVRHVSTDVGLHAVLKMHYHVFNFEISWMACFHLNDYIVDLSKRLRFRMSLSSLRLASIQPRTDIPSCDGPFCVVWAPSTMTKLRKRLRYFEKQHSPNLHQNVSKIVSKRLL